MNAINLDDEIENLGRSTSKGPNIQTRALIDAWRDEVHAPEILKYQSELVEQMLTNLKTQQGLVEKIQATIEEDHQAFTVTLYQMDIERIRYSISRYLRARLLKIEANLESILADFEMSDRLSLAERLYASKLQELNRNHVKNTIVKLATNEDVREYLEMSDDFIKDGTPDLQEYVFFRANRDFIIDPIRDPEKGVHLVDEENRTLRSGDIALTPYLLIRERLLDGSVNLI